MSNSVSRRSPRWPTWGSFPPSSATCSGIARSRRSADPLGFEFEEDEAAGLSATAKTVLKAAGWPDGEEDVVMVGHQPTLGEVAAKVLGTKDDCVSIKKGAVWWFVSRDGETTLRA